MNKGDKMKKLIANHLNKTTVICPCGKYTIEIPVTFRKGEEIKFKKISLIKRIIHRQ